MIRLKWLVFFAVIPLVLGLRPSSAEARKMTALDREYFEGLFAKIVTADAPWPDDELVITNFFVSPDPLMVPDGSLGHRVLNQVHGGYLGKKVVSVAMLVDGEEAGRVKMAGELALVGEVVVAAESLGRHAIITAGDIRLERKDITTVGAGYLQDIDEVVGKRLKTGIRPGEVIFSRLLEAPPVIKKGDPVTIIARSPGVMVTVSGEAKNNGAKGDLVRVKNLMSRKEVMGRVIDEKTVRVEF